MSGLCTDDRLQQRAICCHRLRHSQACTRATLASCTARAQLGLLLSWPLANSHCTSLHSPAERSNNLQSHRALACRPEISGALERHSLPDLQALLPDEADRQQLLAYCGTGFLMLRDWLADLATTADDVRC